MWTFFAGMAAGVIFSVSVVWFIIYFYLLERRNGKPLDQLAGGEYVATSEVFQHGLILCVFVRNRDKPMEDFRVKVSRKDASKIEIGTGISVMKNENGETRLTFTNFSGVMPAVIEHVDILA